MSKAKPSAKRTSFFLVQLNFIDVYLPLLSSTVPEAKVDGARGACRKDHEQVVSIQAIRELENIKIGRCRN